MNVESQLVRTLSHDEMGSVSGGADTVIRESVQCLGGVLFAVYLNVCTGERHSVNLGPC